jgi:hypothetical protein
MASTLAGGNAALRGQPTVASMRDERVWNAVTRRSMPAVHGADDAGSRPATFGDGVLAVCFLAIVGLVVLGGVLMLFSWVTATLPRDPISVCREFDGCVMPTPDEGQAIGGDDPRIDAPRMTP